MNKLVLNILIVFFIVSLSAISFNASELYFTFLSLAPLLIILLGINLSSSSDVFSPLYLVAYLVFIGVSLKTVFLLSFDEGFARQIALDGRDLSILENGLYITLVGCTALVVGYLSVSRKQKQKQYSYADINLNSSRYKLILVFTLIISAITFLIFVKEMNIINEVLSGKISVKRTHEATTGVSSRGSSLTYLRWGAQTLPQIMVFLSLALILSMKLKLKWRLKWKLYIIGLISIAIPILTSARLEMIYFGIFMLMIFNYYKKRIDFSKLIVFFLVTMLGIGLLGQVRYIQTSGNDSGKYFEIQDLINKTLSGAYFMDIGKTSVIADTIPSKVDYLMGESFLLFLYAPIPRTLWKEKPIVRISQYVGDELYTRADDSGIPPGFIGELYMNFGYVGVALGMYALGMILKLLYVKTVLNPKTRVSFLWYSIISIILTFTLLSGDFTVTISQLVRYGIPLFILSSFIKARKKGYTNEHKT